MREEKIFYTTTYLETKSFIIVQAKFCRKFNLTIIPRKAKFIIGYTNFINQLNCSQDWTCNLQMIVSLKA